MNCSATCRCWLVSADTAGRGLCDWIFVLALRATWRQVAADLPSVSAMAVKGIWKTSWRMNATRSAGVRRSSTTRRARRDLIVEGNPVGRVDRLGRRGWDTGGLDVGRVVRPVALGPR